MRFYKHVQTCFKVLKTLMWFDTILQTCSDLFKYYDTIWYDSKNMSRLVQISWYLQTCPDVFKYYNTIWYDSTNMSKLVHDFMTRFDTILQTCPDMFKYYDMIWYDSTRLKLKTWRNTLKLSKWHKSFVTDEKLFLGSLRASWAIKNLV